MMQGIVNSSSTTPSTNATASSSVIDGVGRDNIQKKLLQRSIPDTSTVMMDSKHHDHHDSNSNTHSSFPTITSDLIHYPYTTTTSANDEGVLPLIATITNNTAITATTVTIDKNKRKRTGGTMIHPGRKK